MRYATFVLLLAGATSCQALKASFHTPVTCSGGAELIDNSCWCADGMTWNGQTCQGTPIAGTCPGNSYPFGPPNAKTCHCLPGNVVDATGQCAELQCSGGAVAGYAECECPAGSTWDGAQCVAPAADPPPAEQPADQPVDQPADQTPDQPPPPPRTCTSVMAEKGFAPALWPSCRGVDQRCAVALLDHGYQPALLPSCKDVDGACAEQLLQQYQPALLPDTCGRHRHR